MKKQWTIGWLVLAMLAPASAQLATSHSSTQAAQPVSAVSQPVSKPVARVNGTVLTDRDLLREEYVIFPYARQHGGSIPKDMEPGIRTGAMQMIIFEELVYQEAVRRKVTVPTAKLKQAQADFRKQFNSEADYQNFLNAECQGSEQVLREKIQRSILIEALLHSDVESKAVVTATEARAYYDANPAKFSYPESFAIQTISFIPPSKATPEQVMEARKRAEAALPKAKATKSYEEFGVLAEKISEDDYRVMMGDHKAVDRTRMAPQLAQALEKMQVGQVTDVMQIEQLYTIVRLNKHTPAGKEKFELVKERLTKQLEQKKTNDVRAALDKKLRQNATVEVL